MYPDSIILHSLIVFLSPSVISAFLIYTFLNNTLKAGLEGFNCVMVSSDKSLLMKCHQQGKICTASALGRDTVYIFLPAVTFKQLQPCLAVTP